MAKEKASIAIARMRAEKAANETASKAQNQSPPKGGNFGGDYSSGVTLTVVIVTLFVFLTLVIARGNGQSLLEAIETEKQAGKFMLAFSLLAILAGMTGQIGRGVFYLLTVGALFKMGPDALENANKLIDSIFK